MKQQALRKVFLSLLTVTMLAVMTMKNTELQAKELAPHLYKETLGNGLTVIVKETPDNKAATVQIRVKAGSVYEDEHEKGITHLIEHMIFKGTPTRGPGEVAGAIEEVGGKINAYTSYEHTVYYAILSARHWDTALEVLTDAVLNSTFDPEELEREKKVVIEEIYMRKDRPSIALYQELMANAYTTHPYHYPISGSVESVSAITRDDILKYMSKHYHPEDFTVVVVGDVHFENVLNNVKKLMGGLPKGEYYDSPLPKEPPQEKPRFFTVQQDINQSHFALAIPIAPFDNPDTPVLDIISNILGHGETSRLYHQLRDKKQLVYQIDSSTFAPKDPGLLEVSAVLDAENFAPALEAALEEIFKLKYLAVSDDELERAKRSLESEFVFNLERVEGQASVLGSLDFLTGDPREDKYLEMVRAVTPENIKQVASYYFNPKKITVGIIAPNGGGPSLDQADFTELIAKADEAAKHGLPTSLVPNSYLSDVHRFTLPNGIRLLVRENKEIPTLAIRAIFPGGLRGETENTNGAFAFISELLPKGTEQLSARDLAIEVADMAGSLKGFNGKNTFGLKADFLARFLEEGLTLVRDVVRTPAFSPEEAEKVRPELLAQLKNQEDSLPSLAFKEFNSHLFRGHPYALNTAGSETALKNFSVQDLKKIYQQYARPDTLVLAVAGDVDAEQVRTIVTRLFGDWKSNTKQGSTLEESLLPPDPPPTPDIVAIPRDKEQVHIIIGFLGASLTSKDRFALEVLDTVLSGQSGRLFTELRDKQSLAYSLSSFSLLGLDTGSFGIYIATSPDKKDAAIKEVWQQLYKIREERVSDEELQRAKNVLISQYELGLQTHGNQAMEMALNETYDLGQDYGTRYTHEIERIDAQEVLAIARKYILSDHYVMVMVGAASPAEQPKETPGSVDEGTLTPHEEQSATPVESGLSGEEPSSPDEAPASTEENPGTQEQPDSPDSEKAE